MLLRRHIYWRCVSQIPELSRHLEKSLRSKYFLEKFLCYRYRSTNLSTGSMLMKARVHFVTGAIKMNKDTRYCWLPAVPAAQNLLLLNMKKVKEYLQHCHLFHEALLKPYFFDPVLFLLL